KTSQPRATATSKRAAEPLSVQCVALSADVGAALKFSNQHDHTYEPSEEMVRSKVRILSEELKGLKKELKNTAAREQRAKERLSDSLQKLKEQNFINAELHLKLEAYEDIPVELFSRPTWMQHVDAEPGINLSMMQALIVKKNENPDHYTHCCFMLDAMSIRQEWSYDRCWNNNPFVNHFKAAFRALISRCGAAAVYGSIGNSFHTQIHN
ncbi:hypothetical protein CAPTEDRAFT_197435, partial [Capitella teleta]